MIHNEYKWKGLDGIMLFGQSWMPDTNPRTVINYVHGFKDHSSRFEKWAVRLAHEGYGVIAIDLRGHGHSAGRRGYAKNFNCYLDDVSVLRRHAEEMHGHAYQILYGHSLGGNLVTNYLIAGQQMPDAAVVSSPWFTLSSKPSWLKMAMARIMRTFLPGMSISSELEVQYLSHNDDVVSAYLRDPLVHNLIRPKLFLEIEKNGLMASRGIYKINIPLLVMHGTDDHITSYRQTKSFVANAGQITTFKPWPDGYHELHNDFQEKEVFEYLLNWIRQTETH